MHSQPYIHFTLSTIIEYTRAVISVAVMNVKACCMSNILPTKHGWSTVYMSIQSEVGLYAGKVSCSTSFFHQPYLHGFR